jgi:hypothetical protein
LEECGPAVAFPAALFCMTGVDDVGELVGFVEPLLGRATAVDAERVSCGGVELGIAVYTELRQQLEEAVERMWREFMVKGRPDMAKRLCVQARTGFAGLVAANGELENVMAVREMADKLAVVVDAGPLDSDFAAVFAAT